MFCDERCFKNFGGGRLAKIVSFAVLTSGIACLSVPASAQQPGQKTFRSASQATKSLVQAVQKDDESTMLSILGPDAKDIISSGDSAEDKNDRTDFVQKYRQMHRLVTDPDGKTTLYIGAENWPTPIPLVHQGSEWYFDTPAGKQEILYRRIGRNELSVIQMCRELVDAEKEYYAKPHDGEPKHYAQKFFSSSNKQDGLYWKSDSDQGNSPIGPLVAAAAAEGSEDTEKAPEPYHGYYFRILTGQGANAPGGARSYLVNGKMTRGFAFLAFPAEYRSSGVMTFIVNQDGVVYEKDLGARTSEIAKKLTRYNRDASWRKANQGSD